MRCKQWIFDMDGTLTDSMVVVWEGAPEALLARTRAMMAQHSTLAFDFRVEEVAALGRHPHRRQPAPVFTTRISRRIGHVCHGRGHRYGAWRGWRAARHDHQLVQLGVFGAATGAVEPGAALVTTAGARQQPAHARTC